MKGNPGKPQKKSDVKDPQDIMENTQTSNSVPQAQTKKTYIFLFKFLTDASNLPLYFYIINYKKKKELKNKLIDL